MAKLLDVLMALSLGWIGWCCWLLWRGLRTR